ncbi:MAG: hypothetical protein V3R72_08220 [Gammaproteobacteria bacterium]
MENPGPFDGGTMRESMAKHHRRVNSGHAREAAGSDLIWINANAAFCCEVVVGGNPA